MIKLTSQYKNEYTSMKGLQQANSAVKEELL